MVHKNVQDRDYQPIYPGDPIFTLFDGTEIPYEGDKVNWCILPLSMKQPTMIRIWPCR
ncbi:hypothetical protein ALON55S_04909 [Alishewanella longhuensis]